ncbi:MAG: YceI family protein [Pseudomonadota bacterium]
MRLAAALFAASLLSAPALAQDWTLDKAASSVAFEARVFGAAMPGSFEDFDAQITLDPADLSTARIDATVMTASVDTSSQYRGSLVSTDGLAPETHPQARFVSDSITATETGYEAVGELTIKGASLPVTLPFTLVIEGDRATAQSELTVSRSDFGVGGSGWGDVGETVIIRLNIVAEEAG